MTALIIGSSLLCAYVYTFGFRVESQILQALQLLLHSLVYRFCEDLDSVFVLLSQKYRLVFVSAQNFLLPPADHHLPSHLSPKITLLSVFG